MKVPASALESIPGVGKSIAQNLRDIGIEKVSDLKGKNPEKLYARSNEFVGSVQDRCLLYVFRLAVYYASNTRYDSKKLQWWNWKDPKDEGEEIKEG